VVTCKLALVAGRMNGLWVVLAHSWCLMRHYYPLWPDLSLSFKHTQMSGEFQR
jgi:hypothetical protein